MAERALPQPAEEKDLPSPRHLVALPGARQAKELSDPIVDLENAKTIRDATEIMEALKNQGVLMKIKKEHRELYQPTAGNEKKGRIIIDAYIKTLRRIQNAEKESRKNKSPESHIQTTRDQAKKTMARSKPEAKQPRFFPLYITLSNDQTYDTPSDFNHYFDALKRHNPKKAEALKAEYISQLKDRVALIREESESEAKRITQAERIKRQSDQDRPGVRDIAKIYVDMAWIKLSPNGRYETDLPAAQPMADAANKRILELEHAPIKSAPKPAFAEKPANVDKSKKPQNIRPPKSAPQIHPAQSNPANEPSEKPKSIQDMNEDEWADRIVEAATGISPNREAEIVRQDTRKISEAIKADPALKIISRALYAFADKTPEKVAPGMTMETLESILRKSTECQDTDDKDRTRDNTPKGLRDLVELGFDPSNLHDLAQTLNESIHNAKSSQLKAA